MEINKRKEAAPLPRRIALVSKARYLPLHASCGLYKGDIPIERQQAYNAHCALAADDSNIKFSGNFDISFFMHRV